MADGAKVQLLGAWASPYMMRAKCALALKGVEYEYVEEDLRNKSELLLQSNPLYKKVPVLLHKGRPVCESMVIVQYIDDAWPSSGGQNLLPPDAYGRAMARFWADFVDKKVYDALFVWLRLSAKGLQDEKKAAEENIVTALMTLQEAMVGGEGPFFGGEQMGLVDVAMAPLLAWLPALEQVAELNVPWAERLPRLQAAMAAMRAHPATAGLPQPPVIMDFLSTLLIPMYKRMM